jgi:hypothetical protein
LQIEEKHRVPERIIRAVKRAEDGLSTSKANAQRYYKLMMGILPRKRNKRSNLSVRKVWTMVINSVARQIEAQFQFKPYFDLESRSGQNVERADNAEKLLQYYLERAELELKCISWYTQATSENLGVAKLGWKKRVQKVKQRMKLLEARKLSKFKMPDEYKDAHIFLAPDNISVAMSPDDPTEMHLHEGEEWGEYEVELFQQGFVPVLLENSPDHIQANFEVVTEAPKVLYDGLDLTIIDWQDCFWDPDAGTVEELRFAGHHCGKTLADLKAEHKSGIKYKHLEELEKWAHSRGAVQNLARYKRRGQVGKSRAEVFNEDETLFRVTEFWDYQNQHLYTFVSTGGSEWVSDGILIRDEPWPFWHGQIPYHYLPAEIVPFEIEGVGIPELVEYLAHERNEIRNILMDSNVLAVAPPIFVSTDALEDPRQYQNLEPNKVIELDTGDRPIEQVMKQWTPDQTGLSQAIARIDQIDRDMEDSTGVTKPTTGVAIQRRTTYSEQALLKNEADLRFKLKIRVNDAVMKRLATQGIHLLYQFVDPQVEVPITGDDTNRFITVNRDDMAVELDIHPASSSVESLASQQAQAQNMIQWYQTIRGTQLESVIKPVPFAREAGRKMGFKNVNVFLKTEDELAQEMAQQQQAQQAAAQQGQPPPQQQPPDETAVIQQENQMLMQQQVPQVTPEQNHVLHYEGHYTMVQQVKESLMQQGMTEEQTASHPVIVAATQHVQEHVQASPELMQWLQQMEGLNGQGGEVAPPPDDGGFVANGGMDPVP